MKNPDPDPDPDPVQTDPNFFVPKLGGMDGLNPEKYPDEDGSVKRVLEKKLWNVELPDPPEPKNFFGTESGWNGWS